MCSLASNAASVYATAEIFSRKTEFLTVQSAGIENPSTSRKYIINFCLLNPDFSYEKVQIFSAENSLLKNI